jgi:hypothetical protein
MAYDRITLCRFGAFWSSQASNTPPLKGGQEGHHGSGMVRPCDACVARRLRVVQRLSVWLLRWRPCGFAPARRRQAAGFR